MKRFVVVISLMFVICMLMCACSDKKTDAQPTPRPTGDVQESSDTTVSADTVASDTTQSDETVPVDDTTESDSTETEAKLTGAWMSEDKTFTISFSDDGECVIARDGKNIICEYSVEDDTLVISDGEEYSIVKLTKKKLTLKSNSDTAGNEEEIYLRKLGTRLKDLTEADFVGSWVCRIEDDGDYIEMTFVLSEDGTAAFTEDINGDVREVTDAVWHIKSGRLVLDNGTGTDSSQLKYSIVAYDTDTCIFIMEHMAVAVVRK